MNFEKVVFGFFILLALTLNFGFVMGDIDNPDHHHVWELYAALVVSIIATILKLGDRTHIGAVLLATSLVADLQLLAAALLWGISSHVFIAGETPAVAKGASGGTAQTPIRRARQIDGFGTVRRLRIGAPLPWTRGRTVELTARLRPPRQTRRSGRRRAPGQEVTWSLA